MVEPTADIRAVAPSAAVELARAAAAGDAQATAKLLRAVAPQVAKVVRAMLGNGHPDLHDVAQQALIGLVRALPAYRAECAPEGYASTIALRTALAARRRASVERARRDDAVDADTLRGEHESPEEQALGQRRKELLRKLLDELPPEQAEALALRIMLGWSLEDVAAASGAPLNTIRSRLRLAKEALRKRIESDPALADALSVGP